MVFLFLMHVFLQVSVLPTASGGQEHKVVAAFIGETVVLQCPGNVTKSAIWQHGTKGLEHVSNEIYHGGRLKIFHDIVKTKFELQIDNTTSSDTGQYCCEDVYEARPTQFCFNLQLFVKPEVEIVKPPDDMFYKGGNVTISCVCDCDPVSIKWVKSNMILSNETELQITNLSNSHVGTYRCVVKNEIGSISSDVKVAIKYAPNIPYTISVIPYKSGFRLNWIPDCDGGLAQNFYILYRMQDIKPWISKEPISDTTVLDVLNLKPDTIYDVAMYASNALGNSSSSNILNVHVKAEDKMIQGNVVLNYVLFTLGASLFFFSFTAIYTIGTHIMDKRARTKKINIHV